MELFLGSATQAEERTSRVVELRDGSIKSLHFFPRPSWSFQHPLVESRRWENNYFVIINISMHDFLLIQFNYIVKQALSETTGAWF